MTAMKQPQLAGIAAEPERLAGVQRRHSNPKSPRVGGFHRRSDLPCEAGVDELALAQNQNPIVRGGIDRPIQLRARVAKLHARREIGHHLFEMREMRCERLDRFRLNVAEGDDREFAAHSSRLTVRGSRFAARGESWRTANREPRAANYSSSFS